MDSLPQEPSSPITEAAVEPPATDAGHVDPAASVARHRRRSASTPLRGRIPRWQAVLVGVSAIVICGAAWWWLTTGPCEQRVLSPSILPSPQETFAGFPSLWFDRALTRNTLASLRRVTAGFGLAVLVGVPLGVLCACFPRIDAFFAPLTIIGRNIPVAALIPLTFSFFGIGEFQKIMFIFIACVAFVMGDSAASVRAVAGSYIDTALTLGANRRQVVLKVLVPLAMPDIFNSLRLLFGLAFGYIMLAELIKFGDTSGGLGDIINISLRRGLQSHILLVLMIIPLVALGIDRVLYWIQRELFPYRYGSYGVLHRALRWVFSRCEDAAGWFRKPVEYGLFDRETAILAPVAEDAEG